jgi:hypothetical protein
MPSLVFDYLLHQRCWQTAAIVARDMLTSIAASSSEATAAAAAAAAAEPRGGAAAEPMECTPPDDQDMPDASACSTEAGGSSSSAAAAAAAASTAVVSTLSEADIKDALIRQQVFDAISAGHIAEALDKIASGYGSSVLDNNPRLAFKIRVQVFVELVRAASSGGNSSGSSSKSGGSGGSGGSDFSEALAYGRAQLGPVPKAAEDEELLSDALSLLAYADPSSSPCGHLLRPGYRTVLAEELNGALLKVRQCAPPLLPAPFTVCVELSAQLVATLLFMLTIRLNRVGSCGRSCISLLLMFSSTSHNC